MLRTTGMLCMLLLVRVAIAEPVYRCEGPGGVPHYSDRRCPGAERIEEEALQPNLFTAPPIAETLTASRRPTGRTPRRKSGPADCNNADDLRHIELMLKSLTTDPEQVRFLRAERRRVQNCELENLSAIERNQRDAALRRTGALSGSERDAAEREIETLYRAARSGKRPD